MKYNKKNKRFELRTTTEGRTNIAKLARRLKVKESEAVRRAVVLALEITPARGDLYPSTQRPTITV